MSFTKLLAAVATALVCLHAQAAEPVEIFGLPLGGVAQKSIGMCPAIAEKSKVICWIGKPFAPSYGGKLGTVHLPNPDSRPRWAAYAMFTISTLKDGTLDSLSVKTVNASDKAEI